MPETMPFQTDSLSGYFFEFLKSIESEIDRVATLSVLAFCGFMSIDNVVAISTFFNPDDAFLEANKDQIKAKTAEFFDNSDYQDRDNRPFVATTGVLQSILTSIGFNDWLETVTEGDHEFLSEDIDPLFEWFESIEYGKAETDSAGKSTLHWLEDLGFVGFTQEPAYMVSRSIQPVVIDGAESDNVILIAPLGNPTVNDTYQPIPSVGGGAAFTFSGEFKKTNNYAFDLMGIPSDQTVLFFVDGFSCTPEEVYFNGVPLVLPEE